MNWSVMLAGMYVFVVGCLLDCFSMYGRSTPALSPCSVFLHHTITKSPYVYDDLEQHCSECALPELLKIIFHDLSCAHLHK